MVLRLPDGTLRVPVTTFHEGGCPFGRDGYVEIEVDHPDYGRFAPLARPGLATPDTPAAGREVSRTAAASSQPEPRSARPGRGSMEGRAGER